MTTFLRPRRFAAVVLVAICFVLPRGARADDTSGDWSLHAQVTFVDQFHPAFRSPYRGANSLDPGSRGDETFDATLFVGARLWNGGEVWLDSEVDQGFGLSGTFGVADFPSGEAYKVGSSTPYVRIPRLFVRQVLNLGGDSQNVEADSGHLQQETTANNLIITAGKFSVVDIFDTNSYAGDPKADFMNWTVINSGAFDYAADAWAYTYGGAVEWTVSQFTLRGGVFDMSRIPNGKALVRGFGYYALIGELERRHSFLDMPGSVKLLVFDNRASMGSYGAALALAEQTGTVPSTALVRHYAWRPGIALNLQQAISDELGFFLRASANDGREESYEFTDVNRSIAAGFSLKGVRWGRPQDRAGIAQVTSFLSRQARDYFAAGGLGTLIGDGQLPHYAPEQVLETYYSAAFPYVTLTADYQFVANPGYNRDRGPVSILGMRVHSEF
jgi:high affinity Mn2+ porin